MSQTTNDICLNLAADQMRDLQPLPRFVSVILQQALHDGAERIEFSLEDPSSEKGFRIKYSGKELNYEIVPAASSLFDPAVVVLCNCASVPYYASGTVRGILQTKQPDSRWRLESDNLKKHVSLSRT
jgi:hypothetical protein